MATPPPSPQQPPPPPTITIMNPHMTHNKNPTPLHNYHGNLQLHHHEPIKNSTSATTHICHATPTSTKTILCSPHPPLPWPTNLDTNSLKNNQANPHQPPLYPLPSAHHHHTPQTHFSHHHHQSPIPSTTSNPICHHIKPTSNPHQTLDSRENRERRKWKGREGWERGRDWMSELKKKIK